MLMVFTALVAASPVAASLAFPLEPISGVVRTASGQPAGGVLVIARDSLRAMTHLVVTDALGEFRLAHGATAGDLMITATTATGDRVARRRVAARPEPTRLELTLESATPAARRPTSAAWLAALPEGEARRRFILDCTGCHQFDETRAMKSGARRSTSQFAADIGRMLGYAGPSSSFPVISKWAEGPVAEWITGGLEHAKPAAGYPVATLATDALITEYDFAVAADLPHDVAVEASGAVVVTGMFSHAMYRLDPAAGQFDRVEIPVPQANPRAVEIDAAGNWWVLLGGPGKVGRYDIQARSWRFFDIGMYPHSIALAENGDVWFNGHFTRDPEQIGRIRAGSGAIEVFALPPHPTLQTVPGGPIPYEQRIAPDGTVWISELQGNRLVAFDPSTGRGTAHPLPTSWAGPRRFDIDAQGVLWIPAYAANALIRFDPASGRFTEIPLPIPGATPYIARVEPKTGSVWIGTSAADAALRYDPSTRQFAVYPLPSQGALVRHMAIDSARGDVWLAYGASPGRVSARIARIRRER